MNLQALWSAARRWYAAHSQRDRGIILGLAVAVGLSIVYVAVVEPVRGYRRSVAEEIVEGREQLERAARFIGALDTLRTERVELRQHVEQAKTRLLPGDSGTLGAAALQERVNALATEKGIAIQSVQVMREEQAEPFRKVAVRLTLTGEPKPLADFVAGLEYGPQQLSIPFVEVNRRGAVPGAKGPRTLTATVEVGGYLLPSEKQKPVEAEVVEEEGEAVIGAPESEATGGAPTANGEGPGVPGAMPGKTAPAPGPPLATPGAG